MGRFILLVNFDGSSIKAASVCFAKTPGAVLVIDGDFRPRPGPSPALLRSIGLRGESRVPKAGEGRVEW